MVEFNDQFFEKRLLNLKETQDSITGLSAWCLQHRESHKVIVGTWLKVLKKGKTMLLKEWFKLAIKWQVSDAWFHSEIWTQNKVNSLL